MHALRGRRPLMVVATLALLGGCAASSGDIDDALDAEVLDPAIAARYDFTCWQQALPDRAASDYVRLDGYTNDSYSGTGLSGVMVSLLSKSDDSMLDAVASDQNGVLGFELPTGSAPIDHYARMQRDGHVTSYLYPSRPLVADQHDVFFPVLSPEWREMLAGFAGVELDAARGIVAVIVTDCAGARVEGATVTFDPPADAVAAWDPTFTDASGDRTSLNGHAWGFNVPAGVVHATVSVGGAIYRDWPVQSFADSRTMSWRAP